MSIGFRLQVKLLYGPQVQEAALPGGACTWRVDDGEIRAEFVLYLDHNLLGPELLLTLQAPILALNMLLRSGQLFIHTCLAFLCAVRQATSAAGSARQWAPFWGLTHDDPPSGTRGPG